MADNSNLPAGGSAHPQDSRIGFILNGYDVSVQFPSGNPVVWALVAIVALVIIVVVVIVALFLYLILGKRGPHQQMPTPLQSMIDRPAPDPEGNCPVCGRPVRPDFYMCPNCGNRLK